jgi:ParB family chromosome partitioning protein
VQLKPAYPLAQAMDDRLAAASILKAAKGLASEQAARVRTGAPPCPPPKC